MCVWHLLPKGETHSVLQHLQRNKLSSGNKSIEWHQMKAAWICLQQDFRRDIGAAVPNKQPFPSLQLQHHSVPSAKHSLSKHFVSLSDAAWKYHILFQTPAQSQSGEPSWKQQLDKTSWSFISPFLFWKPVGATRFLWAWPAVLKHPEALTPFFLQFSCS